MQKIVSSRILAIVAVSLASSLVSVAPAMANTGSLWCALLKTPTELVERRELPYKEVQIDILKEDVIQLDITDHYRDGEKKVLSYRYVTKMGSEKAKTISGIKLGTYAPESEKSETESLAPPIVLGINSKGKITLTGDLYCEIPGQYKASYSADESQN